MGSEGFQAFLLKHKACRCEVHIFWGFKCNQTERRKVISLAQPINNFGSPSNTLQVWTCQLKEVKETYHYFF